MSVSVAGFTDDVLEYIRVSVPKNMLADLKDSVKQGRSLNVQDKYGATAVSLLHTTTQYGKTSGLRVFALLNLNLVRAHGTHNVNRKRSSVMCVVQYPNLVHV